MKYLVSYSDNWEMLLDLFCFCAFFIGVALLSLVGGGCFFFSLSPKNRRNNSFNILLIYLSMGSTVPERCGKVEERVKKQRVIKGVKYMSEEKFVVGYYRGERVNASLQQS